MTEQEPKPQQHRPDTSDVKASQGPDIVTVDPSTGEVTGDGGGRSLYWLFKNILIGPGIKRVFRPVVEGIDNVPAHGPAIIASNHLSVADWLFTPLALRRRITYVAKSDYFTGTGVKGFVQRRFFAGTGQVPIDRSGGKASMGALKAGLRVLRRGELFGIFPEGTRSHDGRLYKGRTGVARLALEAKVPVIPTAVINTDIIAPANKHFGRVVTPIVKFGAPLDFSRYEGMSDDRFILRSITDEIMYVIMELSGQEYVDEYATVAREKVKEAERAKPDGTQDATR
ncbi:lysophospholipid acyltransferase family protein [Mariniluteicoccus endophyticus]